MATRRRRWSARTWAPVPRARRAGRGRASFYNLVLLGSVGLLFIAFGDVIVVRSNADPVIVGFGTNALRIISAGFPVLRVRHGRDPVVTERATRARPTLINLFCFWLLELPVAWLLRKPLGLARKGVFIAG